MESLRTETLPRPWWFRSGLPSASRPSKSSRTKRKVGCMETLLLPNRDQSALWRTRKSQVTKKKRKEKGGRKTTCLRRGTARCTAGRHWPINNLWTAKWGKLPWYLAEIWSSSFAFLIQTPSSLAVRLCRGTLILTRLLSVSRGAAENQTNNKRGLFEFLQRREETSFLLVQAQRGIRVFQWPLIVSIMCCCVVRGASRTRAKTWS